MPRSHAPSRSAGTRSLPVSRPTEAKTIQRGARPPADGANGTQTERKAIPSAPEHKVGHLYLVEDHPVVREAYVGLFRDTPGVEVVGAAASAEAALADPARAEADLFLVDISLPGMSGLDFVAALRAEQPDARALMVSGHERAVYGERAAEVGALGYVVKSDGPAVLLEAVRGALR